MKWQLGISSVFLALGLVLTPAVQPILAQTAPSPDASWRALTGAELSKLLTGMDVGAIIKKTSQPYSMYLKPDGSFDGTYTTSSGGSLTNRSGTWRLDGDSFCVTLETTAEYCRGIESQGDAGPYRYADNKLPITINSVRTVTKPGPNLPAVTIVIPGSDVPPDVARFTGVWSGSWDGTYDTVIEVTRIRPDGFAELTYRYVNYANTPFLLSKIRFGRIQGNTLSFGGITLTLRKNDATKADGEVKGTSDLGVPIDRHSAFSKQ